MFNPMDMTGRKILVTGASRGIGRACAILLAELGAQLVLVARTADTLNAVCKGLAGNGHRVLPWDLSDSTSMEALLSAACADGVKLDGLLYAAGICSALPVKYMNDSELEKLFRINFFSFMMLVKAMAKKRSSDGGSIVAISSVAGSAGWQGLSMYGASKGALNAAIKSLAVELAPRFRVNAVAPSNIKTEMLDSLLSVAGEDAIAEIKAKQLLGLGEPEDVANAVAFLLSNASKFITGTTLIVDGGYLAL